MCQEKYKNKNARELLRRVLNPDYNEKGLTKDDVQNHEYFRLYEISCFFYALSGFIRIHQGETQDGINLVVQSIVSYASDVTTMGRPSRWHVIDRYFAFAISVYHFWSLRHSSRKNQFLNVAFFIIGFRFLKNSQKMYVENNQDFLIEHTKWHLIAPIMSLFK